MKNFIKYSDYYNLLYEDKNYIKESEYVHGLIKQYSPMAKSILSIGCGTGRHDIEFAKLDYHVTGIDISEEMIAIANKNNNNKTNLHFLQGDISTIKINKKFDVAVSLFHVMSYLTDNDSLIKAFKNISQHLEKGGTFIFDIWFSPAVYYQKALPRIKKMQNKKLEIIRFANPKICTFSNIVEVRYTVIAKDLINGEIIEFAENHKMRHFSIPEIGLLAEISEFELMRSEEFLTGKTPSEKTWGVCFVLQKQNVNV